ncbi:MAG: endonuclease/exonuclease/phosphatase family protein [Gemmatimonadota bacterium]
MRGAASLGVALAAGALACAAGSATMRGRGEGESVRVLVYNIHAGKDAGGAENLARIGALLRERAPDLVLLQEVDRGTVRSGHVDQLAVLARESGLHAVFGRTLDYDGGAYGIAVLSRWPVLADTVRTLPVDPPQARAGGSYEPRGILEVRVEAPGGALTVLNTHLDASVDDAYRWQEVQAVLAVAQAAAEETGGRVLLGGDFNAEPGSRVVAAPGAAGFVDAFGDCGRGSPLTYPARQPTKRIDYLWLGSAFRCIGAEVLGSEASDHRPVLFDLVPVAR